MPLAFLGFFSDEAPRAVASLGIHVPSMAASVTLGIIGFCVVRASARIAGPVIKAVAKKVVDSFGDK